MKIIGYIWVRSDVEAMKEIITHIMNNLTLISEDKRSEQ